MKAKYTVVLALCILSTSYLIISQTNVSSTVDGGQVGGSQAHGNLIISKIHNYSARFLAVASGDRQDDVRKNKLAYNYVKKYVNLRSCVTNYSIEDGEGGKDEGGYNYSRAASNVSHEWRVTRAVLVYFPLDKVDEYKHEFKWLYRSWVYMLGFEVAKWRTDLVVFIENDTRVFSTTPNNESATFFLNDLNCSFGNLRRTSEDLPMCTLIAYTPLSKRNYSVELVEASEKKFKNSAEKYRFILNDIDIFSPFTSDFTEFYLLLNSTLRKYSYTDSIMMAFEGYAYFKSAGYTHLIRSDMDVFLTPLFGQWLPRHCNDFNVGRGGYSTDFNTHRFARIAKNLRLEYAGEENLGSTWYSTPDQFRLVSYLTLFGMAYLAQEEFTVPEREGKLGVALWPDWHYGVLLLYGQHLALNHLIANKQMNVVKLEDQLDYPSGNRRSVMLMLHIHVFHGDNLFSKFAFKMGKYDNRTVSEQNLGMVKYYALKMALDGKRLPASNLTRMLEEQIKIKY